MHLGLYQRVWIFSFMHAYVCLLASMLYLHVCLCRSRLCLALCPSWVCAYQYLGPLAYVVASIVLMVCLDVTTWEIHHCGVSLLDAFPFSAPCDVILVLLALCHLFGFHCFFASLHACLHVHAWVYISSILQSNGTIDTRSKPTFVLLGHLFLFDNMLFAPVWLSLLLIACLLACSLFTCFFAYLLACFLCHGMYTWSKGATS